MRRCPGRGTWCRPEKPTTSCGNTGPQTSTWSYSVDEPVQRDGHVLRQARPPVRSAISRAGMVPSCTNVAGSSQRWLKMRRPPARPPRTRRPTSALSCASLIGRCVPSATRIVECRHARTELALQRLEHERHRHRPRAVRDEDEDATPVNRELRQPLGRDSRNVDGSEAAFRESLTNGAHRAHLHSLSNRRLSVADLRPIGSVSPGRQPAGMMAQIAGIGQHGRWERLRRSGAGHAAGLESPVLLNMRGGVVRPTVARTVRLHAAGSKAPPYIDRARGAGPAEHAGLGLPTQPHGTDLEGGGGSRRGGLVPGIGVPADAQRVGDAVDVVEPGRDQRDLQDRRGRRSRRRAAARETPARSAWRPW